MVDLRIVGGVACIIIGMLIIAYGLSGVVNTVPSCTGDNETGSCSVTPIMSQGNILIGLGVGSVIIIFGGFLLMWYYMDYKAKHLND